MIDESKYMAAFELVSLAGDAKNDAHEAIKAARAGEFTMANDLVISANKKMGAAHEHQMGLVRSEIDGEQVELNIILVHAQDHLVMAMMMRDMAEELIEVYQQMAKLKRQSA